MLKRKIDVFLQEWKNREHNPLIIKGARQIGKTTSIMEFAKKNYESVIEINFISNPEYIQIFKGCFDVDSIILELSILNPNLKFIPNNTLIFFDEVQEYMDATTSLKFFALDKRFDVICSGSSPIVNDASIGFKEDYTMYSLDFEEFLWAKGYEDNIINTLMNNILELKPYSDLVLEKMNSLFMEYILTGGMPKIVSTYISQGNYSGIPDRQKQLYQDYLDDIRKYVEGLDASRVENMYLHVASQLGKENSKFQITKLGHGARANQYEGCAQWLADAGVVNIGYCLNSLSLPLKGNENPNNYRVYFADTSLLIASMDEESRKDLLVSKNLGVYKGALYENFAAEALMKQGYDLFFFRSEDSRTELDFLIRIKDNIVPIEIKANKRSARSLNTVIDDKKIDEIKYGIKFSNNNIGVSNKVLTLPFFTLFMLKKVVTYMKDTKFEEFVRC